MDKFDLAVKLANLGGLALFSVFVMLELREQRRESRRRAGEQALLEQTRDRNIADIAADLELVLDRLLTREITGPTAQLLPQPAGALRPVRRPAPAQGVNIVDMQRVPRRKRTLSDDPDDDGNAT